MPTSSSSVDRALARLRAASCPCAAAAPRSSWKPTVNTGLSDVIGSWKIIEMSAPRSCRSSRRRRAEEVAAAEHDPLPDRRSSSPAAAGRGSRARSPTCRCPIRRPARRCVFSGMSNEMPLTASNVALAVEAELDRQVADADAAGPSTSSAACHFAPAQLRIERVAQRVGEEAERGHEHRHRGRAATSCHHLPRISSFCASFSIEPHDTTSTGRRSRGTTGSPRP